MSSVRLPERMQGSEWMGSRPAGRHGASCIAPYRGAIPRSCTQDVCPPPTQLLLHYLQPPASPSYNKLTHPPTHLPDVLGAVVRRCLAHHESGAGVGGRGPPAAQHQQQCCGQQQPGRRHGLQRHRQQGLQRRKGSEGVRAGRTSRAENPSGRSAGSPPAGVSGRTRLARSC